MDTIPIPAPIACSVVKLSLNKNIPIISAIPALAIEKISAHLPSHEPFFNANNQKILQIM